MHHFLMGRRSVSSLDATHAPAQALNMSPKNGNPAPPAPAYPTANAQAVAARLRESLLHDKQALEVDKIFKALVKLEGSDLHLKVGQPPMVRVAGTQAAESTADRERGDGRLADPDDGRAKPVDLRRRRGCRLFAHDSRRRCRVGVSVSTCSRHSATSDWWRVESVTGFPTSKVCILPESIETALPLRPRNGAAGRRDRFRQRVRRSDRCSITSTASTANTF